MAKKTDEGGRPTIGNKRGVFVGVTLPPDVLRRVDSHARTIRKKRTDKPSRTAALRDLIQRGLDAAENEFEFGG